jgi:dihydroxyacetone kinase-like protein
MTKDQFEKMVRGAANSIRDGQSLLSELDSVGGDGDHGQTMLRVIDTLQRSLGPGSSPDLNVCLREAGLNVMCVDGGAASSIIGAFIHGMGEGPEDGEMTALFEAGLAAVRQYTQARPGDKTMMDALVPAVEAIRAARDQGKCEAEALRWACRAARAGAENTKGLVSRFGRAKFAGTRTRGYPDPGAISIALIFEGFCEESDECMRGTANA